MTTLRAALLDIDGTLIDSNDGHAQAWVDAFQANGYAITFEQVRPLVGMGGDKILKQLAGLEKESPEGKVIESRRKERVLSHYLQTFHVFPSVRDLLLKMRESGLKLVIATSASEEERKALLEKIGVADLIHEATTSSEAPHSKPDPDMIETALKKAGEPAEACLMLGDTKYDIEAASKAGVCSIALRCGGANPLDLQGALTVYAEPADLLAHYDESPFGSFPT